MTAAMLKRPRSVSCPAMSFACRVWLTQAENRYQPKRSRSSPGVATQDVEMHEEMQIDQPLVRRRMLGSRGRSQRRTYTFGFRSVSMEDVGQQ